MHWPDTWWGWILYAVGAMVLAVIVVGLLGVIYGLYFVPIIHAKNWKARWRPVAFGVFMVACMLIVFVGIATGAIHQQP